jgi:hypothetical protein
MNAKSKRPAWRTSSGCRSRRARRCSPPASAAFSASRSSARTLQNSGRRVQIEKALSDFPEYAQRLRRAHHRRLLSRFHRQSRSRRALWPDGRRCERRHRNRHRRQDHHDDRRRPRALSGQCPLRARFPRDLDALKRVLVPTAGDTGAQVPISMLADISYKTGPPSIRTENGQLVGFVFVDITTTTSKATCAASKRISEARAVSARLLHPMGRPVRISQEAPSSG